MTITKIVIEPKFKKSSAEKLPILFKKHKAFLKAYEELAEFKEPVLLLMRRTNKVEFFENATSGEFKFVHSDGEDKALYLDPAFLQTFQYGKKNFKGYIVYEDEALPYPQKPILYAELFKIAIDKTLADIKKWKAKEIAATGSMWLKIFLGIAAIGGVYVLYTMLAPTPITVQQVVQNVSNALPAINENIKNISILG